MDLEKVKQFLKENEEGKAYLEEVIDSAKESLSNKNKELIEANKKLKKERDESTTKITELEEEVAAKAGTDINDQIEKAVAKAKKENTDLQAKLGESNSRIHNLIVENGLNEALTKANIAKQHVPAVRALIKSENKIEIDEAENVAKVGDKNLFDFVNEWSQGEMGKNYVAAAANSGGSANGGDGKGGNSTLDLSKMSPTEKLKHARRQGAK